MTERAQHLAWCRQRALEILDGGDKIAAVTSLMSDLLKHDKTLPTVPIVRRSVSVQLHGTAQEIRAFIEDCTET
jgi:hypothetical protein